MIKESMIFLGVLLFAFTINAEELKDLITQHIDFEDKVLRQFDGKKIALTGYLFIDQEPLIFPSLDALNNFSMDKKVSLKFKESLSFSQYNGCFVYVIGSLKWYNGKISRFALIDVEVIQRTGLFYQLTKEKSPNESSTCMVQAIVNNMLKVRNEHDDK